MITINNINSDECPYFLNDFFTYQRVVLLKSEKTIEAYKCDLRIFLRYLKVKKGDVPPDTPFNMIDISDIPLEYIKSLKKFDILQYLNYVASERDNTAKTRHRKLASLRMFFKCMHRDLNLIENDPTKDVDYPKMHDHLPKFLTLDESINLLNNMNADDPFYLRDYCIVTLFINCGMRLSELVGLNLQDINLDERSMRLLGKGNKERIIHINDACADAIVSYLSERKPSEKEPNAFFLSKQATRISNRRVEQIVDNALRDASCKYQKQKQKQKTVQGMNLGRFACCQLSFSSFLMPKITLKRLEITFGVLITTIFIIISFHRMRNFRPLCICYDGTGILLQIYRFA